MFVTCEGKRYAVKLLPLQPLQEIVQQVAAKLRPVPAVSDCSLLVDGKAADLSTPLRYAMLTPTAKLEVTTGASRLGVEARIKSLPDSQLGSSPSAPSTDLDSLEREPASHKLQTPEPSKTLCEAANPPTLQQQGAKPAHVPGHTDPALPPSNLTVLGLDRDVSVFTQSELEASSSRQRTEDYPEEFYNFGVEDYAAVMNGYKAGKAQAEAGLRTAKMRTDAQLALAKKFPTTQIRILLPGDEILQMAFQSLDSMSSVKKTLRKCLQENIAAARWYLYTTPPKQILKDDTMTLLQAKLVPAAKLYFGQEGREGPKTSILKSQISALRSAVPQRTPQTAEVEVSTGLAGRKESKSEVRETRTDAKTERTIPKWLKVSKK